MSSRAVKQGHSHRPGLHSALATAAVAAVTVLVVLGFDTTMKESYRAPKLWLFLFGASALLAGVGLDGRSWSGRWSRLRTPVIAAFPLCAVASLSCWWSVAPMLSVEALVALLSGVSVVFACVLLPVRYRWLSLLLRTLGVLVSAWLFWDWLQMRSAPPAFRARFELRASLGNPADASIFLLVPCLLFQQRLHRLCRDWIKGQRPGFDLRFLSLVLAAVLVHAAVLMTQSLSGTLALLLGSAAMFPLAATWRGRAALLLAAASVAAAVWFSPVQPRIVDKISQLSEGQYNAFLTGRLDGWMVALELARRQPILGHGLGVYGSLYNAEKERLIDRGVSFYSGHELHSSFGNAHNELLEVAAELGALGVLAVVWLLYFLCRAIWGLPSDQRRFAVSVLVAMAVVSASHFPFRTAATSLPMLLIAGWILSRKAPAAVALSKAERPTSKWMPVMAFSVALLTLWLALARLVLPAIGAERALWLAESQAGALGAVESVAQRRSWEAIRRSLEQYFERRPFDARLPLTIGSYWMLAGEPERAKDWYQRSLAVEVRPETLLNLSRAQRDLGLQEEATLTEERLLQLDPFRRRLLRPQ